MPGRKLSQRIKLRPSEIDLFPISEAEQAREIELKADAGNTDSKCFQDFGMDFSKIAYPLFKNDLSASSRYKGRVVKRSRGDCCSESPEECLKDLLHVGVVCLIMQQHCCKMLRIRPIRRRRLADAGDRPFLKDGLWVSLMLVF